MANTLSKTGIINGQTIQVGHVTQSIDAFNGTTAYDITLSGSLTLTGSVSSLNGFTGSLKGDITGEAQTLDTSFYPNGTGPVLQSAKIIAGTAILNGGTPAISAFFITELVGKTLGVNCFVTATLSGSSPYTGTVNVGGLTGGTLSFTGNNGNTDLFFFQAVYY
tara:strand:+ start:2275 stop:2766 length:492 start_codon:yes stop_codon:yes gene_type:complete